MDSHVVVYVRSLLVEQTTPAAIAIIDIENRVDSLSFGDDDLDANELGGTVAWTLAVTATRVTSFRVFLSTGSSGQYRSQVGVALSGSARDVVMPAETPKKILETHHSFRAHFRWS